jgi:hypothetical protein
MIEVSIPVVRCGECQTELFESPGAPADEREPCPACGSTARTVTPMPVQVPADPPVRTERDSRGTSGSSLRSMLVHLGRP